MFDAIVYLFLIAIPLGIVVCCCGPPSCSPTSGIAFGTELKVTLPSSLFFNNQCESCEDISGEYVLTYHYDATPFFIYWDYSELLESANPAMEALGCEFYDGAEYRYRLNIVANLPCCYLESGTSSFLGPNYAYVTFRIDIVKVASGSTNECDCISSMNNLNTYTFSDAQYTGVIGVDGQNHSEALDDPQTLDLWVSQSGCDDFGGAGTHDYEHDVNFSCQSPCQGEPVSQITIEKI